MTHFGVAMTHSRRKLAISSIGDAPRCSNEVLLKPLEIFPDPFRSEPVVHIDNRGNSRAMR